MWPVAYLLMILARAKNANKTAMHFNDMLSHRETFNHLDVDETKC